MQAISLLWKVALLVPVPNLSLYLCHLPFLLQKRRLATLSYVTNTWATVISHSSNWGLGWLLYTNYCECRRTDAFELWCWRRLLRVPWTARRSNQSILKEISPGISLEGLMLGWNSNTLATSCKELTHWKRLWCWEGLGAGGEGDDRGWDGWMASPAWWTRVWVNSGSCWWTGSPGVLQLMGLQRVGHDRATELNGTELNWRFSPFEGTVWFTWWCLCN